MTLNLLGAGYQMGNTIGVAAAWFFVILFSIVWIWVMFKYLDTSDLK